MKPVSRIQRRDRAMLVFYAVRQATSLAILIWLTSSAFQLPDSRLAWAGLAGTTVFAAWVTWVLIRSIRTYRKRYRAVESKP